MAGFVRAENYKNMRQRLVIRLNSDPAGTVHWIRLDADGRPEGHAESGSLAAAAAAAEGRRVVGLVPTADLLLLTARIPTRSRQKAMQAVPFALEDQVADDIDSLHFALGGAEGDGGLAVAVIARDKLQGWLQACQGAGLEPDQLYPDVHALPLEPEAWTVLVEGDRFAVRTAPQLGFSGDLDYLEVLLQGALDEAGEAGPKQLVVYSAEGPVAFAGSEIPVDNREPGHTTEMLATGLDERAAIPLRTGPYARRRSLGVHWQRWRVAAILLAGWVLVDTGAAYLEQWRLGRQLSAVEREIEQTYRQAFPTNGPVLNPRLQMESRLTALRKQAGADAGLLKLLDSVGPILRADAKVQLVGLNWRNQDLDLELTAPSTQAIDELNQRLRGVAGISVKVDRIEVKGEGAQGRLTIETSS